MGDDIKMVLRYGRKVWTVFIWPRIGTIVRECLD